MQEGAVCIGGVPVSQDPQAGTDGAHRFCISGQPVAEGKHPRKCSRLPAECDQRAGAGGALRAAQCDDILEKLPKGVDTVLGTKGVYLSGGEQQRIALARAILKDAPIVLLDEATAFADPENEHKIQMAFERLTRGKTVLMIAHRLPTIQKRR